MEILNLKFDLFDDIFKGRALPFTLPLLFLPNQSGRLRRKIVAGSGIKLIVPTVFIEGYSGFVRISTIISQTPAGLLICPLPVQRVSP